MLRINRKLFEIHNLESKTLDGRRIELAANIELPSEVDKAIKYGTSSIGLFRSEFLCPREVNKYMRKKFGAGINSPGMLFEQRDEKQTRADR